MKREIEVAWAAGLFEGEGSWYITSKPYRAEGARLYGFQPGATLTMTDEDVVKRFYGVVGVGNFYSYKWIRGNRRRVYVWQTSGKSNVEAVIALFYDYMGVRRKAKADEVLLECRRPRPSRKRPAPDLCSTT